MSGNQIVQVNVSQTIAGAPSQLQKTGLIITQGGTTGIAGTRTLIANQAGLTAILAGAATAPAIELQAAYTTFAANNPTGRAVYVFELGTGATAGYLIGGTLTGSAALLATWKAITNGTMSITIDGVAKALTALDFSAATTMFGVAAVINTGLGVVGTCTWNGQAFVVTSATTGATSTVAYAVVTTGTDVAVLSGLTTGVASIPVPGYAAGIPAGVSALNLYIQAHLKTYYAVLIPDLWSAEATFVAMTNNYTGTTQSIYFYFHATAATYGSFAGKKSCFMAIKAAAALATEKTIAAFFASVLQYDPSATNQVTPMAFRYLFGVTVYPVTATEAIAFKAGNLNFVDTGAEGGISTSIAKWGTTADGRDVTYWYSVDWCQINLELDIANEIINGSNNPLAPLYYNQNGINRLLARAQGVMNRAVTFGLALSPVTVTAQSFVSYTTQNPADYALGEYGGLSCSYTPARGFVAILFVLQVTDFVAGA